MPALLIKWRTDNPPEVPFMEDMSLEITNQEPSFDGIFLIVDVVDNEGKEHKFGFNMELIAWYIVVANKEKPKAWAEVR